MTDVIVTHAHWDHIGGLSQFQDAVLHVTNASVKSHLRAKNALFYALFLRAEKTQRLHVTNTVHVVAPGVAVVPIGLHSPDFQYVVVRNSHDTWVAASDIAPLYANFKNNKPTGQTSSEARTLAVQETMRLLVNGDIKHIIPGHEPSVYASESSKCVEFNSGRPKPKGAPVSESPKDNASYDK